MESTASPAIARLFQSYLDRAVEEGVAPGLQFVLFNRDSYIFNGVSGSSVLPSSDEPEGAPMQREDLAWIASCAKISVSLIVLHLIDKGLTKTGFIIDDLDDHEALIKVLPEFRHGSGFLTTKIIEGFEEGRDSSGRKIMKLRDTKEKVTLRQLLTHTAGVGYEMNHPYLKELFEPSDGSVPHYPRALGTGELRSLNVPLVSEPGTAFTYGAAVDWLGLFARRATGKSFGQLFEEILIEPLGIPASEAGTWFSPSDFTARVYFRSKGGFTRIPVRVHPEEEHPPEENNVYAGPSISASAQAYAKILQAVAAKDSRLLNRRTWDIVLRNDLKERGITVPKPLWMTFDYQFSHDVPEFARLTDEETRAGVNLLQCSVATSPAVSGRPAGSFGWGGLPNPYFFVDSENGIGAFLVAQVLPFCDPQIIEIRDTLEGLVYQNLSQMM